MPKKAPMRRLCPKQKGIDDKKQSYQDDNLQALLPCCTHKACPALAGLRHGQNLHSKGTTCVDTVCKPNIINANISYKDDEDQTKKTQAVTNEATSEVFSPEPSTSSSAGRVCLYICS